MSSRRLRCPPAWQAHSLPSRECAWQADHERIEPECREKVHIVQRRVTPWRELTRHCSLRPGGASLQAETGRSEQGDVRSRSRWPRLVPPPPLFHLTHSLCRRALGCPRQGEGCTIELDSSSLTPGVGRLYQVTPPAGREERGTSLYSSYTDPPHAPRPGRCQEATSGVSCTPASPGPGGSGPASSPSSPPGPAPAAGAIAGAVGARGV